MRFLSSIFSFSRRWTTPAFWLALALVAAYTAGSAYMLSTGVAKSCRGTRVAHVRNELCNALNAASDKKIVLFLGTSKLYSAIDDDLLDRLCPQYKFINLSLHGMTPSEYRLVLESACLTGKVVCVVFEAMPSFHNVNRLHPVLRQKLPYEEEALVWISWKERLSGDRNVNRCDMVIDGLYGRDTLKKHLSGIMELKDMLRGRQKFKHEPFFDRDPVKAAAQDVKMCNNANFSVDTISKNHLNNFEFDDFAAAELYLAIELVRAQHVPSLLLHLPVREGYYDVVAGQNTGDQFKKYRQFFDNAPSEYRFYWKYANECGFSADELFADYGHFSSFGRRFFSKYILNLLLKSGVLEQNK